MIDNLLVLLISRLDYFYELNLPTMGNFIVIQALIFLKTYGKADDSKETLEGILNKHDQHMDKPTKLLLKHYRAK